MRQVTQRETWAVPTHIKMEQVLRAYYLSSQCQWGNSHSQTQLRSNKSAPKSARERLPASALT